MIALQQTGPAHCTQTDDLSPYLHSLVLKARSINRSVFSSISYKTSFSDPLALLESLNQPNSPHAYFEKSTDEFSIACGDYIACEQFHGENRFQYAKKWADSLLSTVERAGDAPIAGTGPTLFLNASFEAGQNPSGLPSLQVFLPGWQVVNQGGKHFVVLNTEIHPHSDPQLLQKQLSQRLDAMVGLKFDQFQQPVATRTSLGASKENFNYPGRCKPST